MAEKTRFDLIPYGSIAEIADVLSYGAQKYSANNWARGTSWGRYFAAMCRHIFAWWGGENKDPETGYSHLAHAGCCLLFLMEFQRNKWGDDDRFKGPDGEKFTKDDGRRPVYKTMEWIDPVQGRRSQPFHLTEINNDDDGQG